MQIPTLQHIEALRCNFSCRKPGDREGASASPPSSKHDGGSADFTGSPSGRKTPWADQPGAAATAAHATGCFCAETTAAAATSAAAAAAATSAADATANAHCLTNVPASTAGWTASDDTAAAGGVCVCVFVKKGWSKG